MDKFEIRFKRNRAIIFSLVSVVLIIVAGFVLQRENSAESMDPVYVIVSTVAIILFSVALWNNIKFLVSSQVAVIISDEGIQSQSSETSTGLTRWEDIEDVQIVDIKGQAFLSIVKNDLNPIKEKSVGFKRILNQMNLQKTKPEILISLKFLDCSIQEVRSEIDRRKAIHLQQSEPSN